MPQRSNLAFRALAAGVDILVANDVVFTQIAAGSDLDQYHWNLARVLHPVNGPERNIDGLVFTDQLDAIINRHLCGAFYDDPIF